MPMNRVYIYIYIYMIKNFDGVFEIDIVYNGDPIPHTKTRG